MSETHSTEMSSSRSENFNHHFLTKKKILKAIHFLLLKWNLLIIWINFRMVFMTKYQKLLYILFIWYELTWKKNSKKYSEYQRLFFTQDYPTLVAQAIYAAYCHSFPDSYRQFNEQFKEDLVSLVYSWIAG